MRSTQSNNNIDSQYIAASQQAIESTDDENSLSIF